MNKKLLAMNCVVALGALTACGPAATTDAGVDTGTVADTGGDPVDAPPSGCGSDGLDCLTIAGGGPANMACTPTAPTGAAREVTFELVKRGLSTEAIAGPFEIWTNNTLGTTCAGDPNCIALTAGADGTVVGTIPENWYAYRAPRNAAAMTFDTVGFNRPSTAGENNTITAIDATIFNVAIMQIRSGITRDVADAIVIGDMADCDGAGVAGVTVRFFTNAGVELVDGTGANDQGLAYRAGGALPVATLDTTDTSGGYAAANIPLGDGLVNVVTYGTLTEGGDREVIGCEQVSIGAGVVTILSLGPSRSDYPAGSFCATMTAG